MDLTLAKSNVGDFQVRSAFLYNNSLNHQQQLKLTLHLTYRSALSIASYKWSSNGWWYPQLMVSSSSLWTLKRIFHQKFLKGFPFAFSQRIQSPGEYYTNNLKDLHRAYNELCRRMFKYSSYILYPHVHVEPVLDNGKSRTTTLKQYLIRTDHKKLLCRPNSSARVCSWKHWIVITRALSKTAPYCRCISTVWVVVGTM